MHNFASIATDRSDVCGLELFRLWDVDENRDYQVKRVWETWDHFSSAVPISGRAGLCAARTIAGEGWLETNNGKRQILGPGSLVILPWLDLAGWGTAKENWRLYWFEFFPDQVESFLIPEAIQNPVTSQERDEIASIQNKIRSRAAASRRSASARFLSLACRWLEEAEDELWRSPRHAGIDQAIDLMQSSTNRQVSIAEMAAQAGLTARTFATAFEQATGQTPKRYHLNLRLDAARALLLSGRANVKQAADQLGFSSPFYLSKLYTSRYGHPPSQAH